jgi:hypothetical protein
MMQKLHSEQKNKQPDEHGEERVPYLHEWLNASGEAVHRSCIQASN